MNRALAGSLAAELLSFPEFILNRQEKRVKADVGESRRRNKKNGRGKEKDTQNGNVQGQGRQKQEISLSEEDLRNVSGDTDRYRSWIDFI